MDLYNFGHHQASCFPLLPVPAWSCFRLSIQISEWSSHPTLDKKENKCISQNVELFLLCQPLEAKLLKRNMLQTVIFGWFAQITAGSLPWPSRCWLCMAKVQGSAWTGPEQTSRSPAAFLLSRLLSSSCMAAPLQVYSESIQQLQLSAIEDPGLLSDAKSVWAAPERSLHLPASSEKQLSLFEWGRIYTSKKTR